MSKYYRFLVPSEPIPAARPRVTIHGTYNPKSSLMTRLGYQLKDIIMNNDYHGLPLENQIAIDIQFFMPVPRSWSKKKKDSTEGKFHGVRPDLDNLIKFILDATNGIIVKDDKQIVKITASKKYSKTPRTVLDVYVL